MNAEDKYLARILFKNKIYESEGNAFEQFFSSIMFIHDKDFTQIKPWGNLGDRSCDGCNKNTKTYYQVYAPENPSNSYNAAVSKLQHDFRGLISYWSPIEQFFFVFNDKFKGVNAQCISTMDCIVKTYNLLRGDFLLPKDLSRIVFDNFKDDEIMQIVGSIPHSQEFCRFNEECFSEIINHLLQTSIEDFIPSKLMVPQWDDKIRTNNISAPLKQQMEAGYALIGAVDNFFQSRESFWGDLIRDKLNGIYVQAKQEAEIENNSDELNGDIIFWKMVNMIIPQHPKKPQCIPSAIQLLSKYFESCDIFEEPINVIT